jgi:hypothetical protein
MAFCGIRWNADGGAMAVNEDAVDKPKRDEKNN